MSCHFASVSCLSPTFSYFNAQRITMEDICSVPFTFALRLFEHFIQTTALLLLTNHDIQAHSIDESFVPRFSTDYKRQLLKHYVLFTLNI